MSVKAAGVKKAEAVAWFDEIDKSSLPVAGGKGANLGEMVKIKLPVPEGFVVTAQAYAAFIEEAGIKEEIAKILSKTDVNDSKALERASRKIRKLIESREMPERIKGEIAKAYEKLQKEYKAGYVAVRSSATAEDLPEASFAGQQDTFLNVKGVDNLLGAIKKCWSSLFTPRAIFYRETNNIEHDRVLIAVVVQKMVNAKKSGVMFTAHPMSGERDKIVIEAVFGLGEGIVSGRITPDHYVVDKNNFEIVEKMINKKEKMIVRGNDGSTEEVATPSSIAEKQVLDESEIISIAKFGKRIEEHYGFPQDIEWAVENGKIYILQSRPMTVIYGEEEKSREESQEEVLVKGLGASPGIGSGAVKLLRSSEELDKVKEGDVLVTTMTNPDMVPAMKRASAIVTDEGGMTCHAAIVSRELGIPAVVGAGNATKVLKENMLVTVDGSRGVVYRGKAKKEEIKEEEKVAYVQPAIVTATEVKVNLSVPDEKVAKRLAKISDGVGLLRVEHIILGLGRHPLDFIRKGEEEKFVNELYKQLKIVVSAFYPKLVYVRTLDAPTDEFRSLKGGEDEPYEHNPMLGWRGIRRGIAQRELLRAEFKAIKKLVEENYNNIGVMIPLVQHPDELIEAKKIAEEAELKPHKDVQFGIMVEIPAAALIIEDFIKAGMDFISFGTNDLTQYTLAVDRNNERVASIFNEKHPAVLKLIERVIKICNERGVVTSICGQAGSDPEMVEKLVKLGITSVSANPDAVERVREVIARTEKKLILDALRKAKADG